MRVLFTSTTGYSHLHPVLPLAQAVSRAGHEVAFAVPRDFASRVSPATFTVFPAGLSAAEIEEETERRFPGSRLPWNGPRRSSPQDQAQAFVRGFGVVAPSAMMRKLVPIVHDWRPDVLVHEATELAAPIAAAVAGIPCADHGLTAPWSRMLRRLFAEAVTGIWHDWGVEPRSFRGHLRPALLRHRPAEPPRCRVRPPADRSSAAAGLVRRGR